MMVYYTSSTALNNMIPVSFYRKTQRYQELFVQTYSIYTDVRFLCLVIICYVGLYIAMRISNDAGLIANNLAGTPVNDTFFRILPRYNTEFFQSNVALGFLYLRTGLFLIFPDRILFAITSVSLLFVTRSIFIVLTHLGPPEGTNPIFSERTFAGDLFFSGHVALPFMFALIYWDKVYLRYLFLGLTVMCGVTTLMGRYHYSIDVFAAPFITYGVFKLTQKFFQWKVGPGF